MSAHRVLLQCSGDFEIATNCVDIDLIWSFSTTFCGHYWVQYREVLFMNYMYLKTKGAWSRSKHCPVPRPKAECSFCKVDLLIGRVRRSWFLQCCETEVYCQKQSIMLFIYCVIIPMKSCDCYSIIFAMSVTDKSWLNLNLKVVLRMLLRMCLSLFFFLFFLNYKMEINSEHFILHDFLHIGETFNRVKCLKYLYKTVKGELEIPNWVKEVYVVILWNWTKSTSKTISFLCARSVKLFME